MLSGPALSLGGPLLVAHLHHPCTFSYLVQMVCLLVAALGQINRLMIVILNLLVEERRTHTLIGLLALGCIDHSLLLSKDLVNALALGARKVLLLHQQLLLLDLPISVTSHGGDAGTACVSQLHELVRALRVLRSHRRVVLSVGRPLGLRQAVLCPLCSVELRRVLRSLFETAPGAGVESVSNLR